MRNARSSYQTPSTFCPEVGFCRFYNRGMRQITIRMPAAVVVMTAQVVVAQTMKPTVPGTPGDPQWQGILRLSDGRTFVTDGGLAIDAALAKPAALPSRELAAKVLETYLGASHKD